MCTAALPAQMGDEIGTKRPLGVIWPSWTGGENETEHSVENVMGEPVRML